MKSVYSLSACIASATATHVTVRVSLLVDHPLSSHSSILPKPLIATTASRRQLRFAVSTVKLIVSPISAASAHVYSTSTLSLAPALAGVPFAIADSPEPPPVTPPLPHVSFAPLFRFPAMRSEWRRPSIVVAVSNVASAHSVSRDELELKSSSRSRTRASIL